MIKIENAEVYGWRAAIRGMRNPMNSWDRTDSHECLNKKIFGMWGECPMVENGDSPGGDCNDGEYGFCIGENDLDLMTRLSKAGPVHGKYLRMITVTCDIVAPLYWWKEFDTYKVGTVADSCSTMHKIHAKEFTLDDFSHEHLCDKSLKTLQAVIDNLNIERENFLQSKDKWCWWQMIQLLPSSYNQRRTVQLNYETLCNIYPYRKDHKLDEWREFCKWIESLPYAEQLILARSKDET